jgi:hypothetical protein
MTRGAGKLTDASTVCALHVTGVRCAIVVAKATSSGVQLLYHERRAAGDFSGVASICERHKVDRVVRVAPAARCVARLAQTPAADRGSMSSAAMLLAEAQLPPDVPAHRRAGAVLPDAERPGVRTVLLSAWTGPGAPPISRRHAESWITAHAALAGLASGRGAATYLSHADGAVIMLVPSGEKPLARTIVLPSDTSEGLLSHARDALRQSLDEQSLAGATSHEGVWIGAGVDALRARVNGHRVDDAFVCDFGLALGAALVALDRAGGLSSLATLSSDAPREIVPASIRFATWISRPRVAISFAVLAIAALLAGPWGLSLWRARIAHAKAGQLEGAKNQTKDISLRAAVFQELEASRWPMTKLLADVSGAAPVGVTIEDIRLTVGQGVSIRGAADSRELVNEFEKNLGQTRLFQGIKQNRNEGKSGGGAEFDISAQVGANAHAPVKPAQDFSSTTLATRLYGEGASNTTMPLGAKREPVRRVVRSGSSDTPGNGTASESRRTVATNSAEAPPAVSDDEIAKMDRSTAMKGWTSRRSFLQKNPGVDTDVKSRLESEIEKMRDRQQRAGATEGGRT